MLELKAQKAATRQAAKEMGALLMDGAALRLHEPRIELQDTLSEERSTSALSVL